MHGRCISDIIHDVLGLKYNGLEICNWIILDVFVILFVVYFYVLFLCSSSNIVCDNDIVCILQKL